MEGCTRWVESLEAQVGGGLRAFNGQDCKSPPFEREDEEEDDHDALGPFLTNN